MVDTNYNPAEEFISCVLNMFHKQKQLAEKAFSQLDNELLHKPLDINTNSIAIIMKHMAGNMLSRWTDFLTTDGEKDRRNRDSEFIDEFKSNTELMDYWEKGWNQLFATLGNLTNQDLTKTITIRGEDHSVIQAIIRQIDHYGYHTGQIVLTARLLAGDNWKTLSIPRGKSAEFNKQVWQ